MQGNLYNFSAFRCKREISVPAFFPVIPIACRIFIFADVIRRTIHIVEFADQHTDAHPVRGFDAIICCGGYILQRGSAYTQKRKGQCFSIVIGHTIAIIDSIGLTVYLRNHLR